MLGSHVFGIGRWTGHHRFARLATTATLACFVAVQTWVVCPVTCLMHGHPGLITAAVHDHQHGIHGAPCHADKQLRAELPTHEQLGVMLPTSWAPGIPAPAVVTLPAGTSAVPHLQQIPAKDPPPPRVS